MLRSRGLTPRFLNRHKCVADSGIPTLRTLGSSSAGWGDLDRPMYATCSKLKHSRAESSVTHVVISFRLLLNLRVAVTPGSALSRQSNLCNVMRTKFQYTAPLAEGERRSDLDKRAMWSGRNSTRDKLPVSSTAEFLVESRKFANVLNRATARQPCPVPRQLAWTAHGILHHVHDGTALHVVRAKEALLVSVYVYERCRSSR